MIKFIAHFILMIAVLTLFCPEAVCAEPDRLTENEIKAAYLYNFAKYVDWPATAFPSESTPLTLCIIGKSPLNPVIESLAKKTIKNRGLAIRQLSEIEDLNGCNILFVNAALKSSLPQILAAAVPFSILTVSDYKGFAAVGGNIEFVPVGDKIRFAINNRTAKRADLKISSHLLRLATTVIE